MKTTRRNRNLRRATGGSVAESSCRFGRRLDLLSLAWLLLNAMSTIDEAFSRLSGNPADRSETGSKCGRYSVLL